MLMASSLAFLLALVASACLGLVMLLTGTRLAVSLRMRNWGLAILGGGLVGAALGSVVLALLSWIVSSTWSSAELWILFGAAGFGWAALLVAAMLVLLAWLRMPNRWIDRRRNANA
jgi:hypothetical protein